MEQLQWIAENWALFVAAASALLAVLKIVNKRTPHASEGKRWWSRALLVMLDLADLIKRTPPPKVNKQARRIARALEQSRRKRSTGGLMALAFCLSLGAGGCATMGEVDRCQALSTAQAGHQIAKGASLIVCQALSGEKRKRCFEEASKAAKAADAALAIAYSVMKACGI